MAATLPAYRQAAAQHRCGQAHGEPGRYEVTLATDYEAAIEQERMKAVICRKDLEITENHMQQLSKAVAMRQRHLRDVEASLAEMEALYTRWCRTLTANVELTGSRADLSPVSPESEANEAELRVGPFTEKDHG